MSIKCFFPHKLELKHTILPRFISKEDYGEGMGIGGTVNKRARKIVEIKNVRIVSDTSDNKKKKVFFTPAKSGNVEIALSIMGDDGRADNIPFSGEKRISIKENERSQIDITLDYPVTDSIVLKAFLEQGDNQQ